MNRSNSVKSFFGKRASSAWGEIRFDKTIFLRYTDQNQDGGLSNLIELYSLGIILVAAMLNVVKG